MICKIGFVNEWRYGNNRGDGYYCRFGKCHKAKKGKRFALAEPDPETEPVPLAEAEAEAEPDADADAEGPVKAMPFNG